MQYCLNTNIEFIPKISKSGNTYVIRGANLPIVISEWFHVLIIDLVSGKTAYEIAVKLSNSYLIDLPPEKILGNIIPYLIQQNILSACVNNTTSLDYGMLLPQSEKPYLHYSNVLSLTLRKQILSPKLLNALGDKFSFLFYLPVYILSCSIFFISILYLIFYFTNTGLLLSPDKVVSQMPIVLPLIFVVNLLVSIIHEMGHVAAARKAGCNCGEMGIGIYLTNQVMYTRLDDVYFLPRNKQFAVNIGGVYFESIIVSVMSILFFFNINHNILALVIFDLLFGILYNLNPITKTDGYWIMSDFFQIPNLHNRVEMSVRRLVYNKKWPTNLDYRIIIIYMILILGSVASFISFVYFILPIYVLSYPSLLSKHLTSLIGHIINHNITDILYNSCIIFTMLLPLIGVVYLLKKIIKISITLIHKS